MVFIHMKIIVTEEQYDRVFNKNSVSWIKRRYGVVKDGLRETFELMDFDICRIDDYKKFETKFFAVFMDFLHPYYYENESFEHDDMLDVLKDLFYVDCTEFYFKGREKC